MGLLLGLMLAMMVINTSMKVPETGQKKLIRRANKPLHAGIWKDPLTHLRLR